MKQVRFEFEELPYETLSQFGLTREMIEDLPMHILEEPATAGTRLYFPSR